MKTKNQIKLQHKNITQPRMYGWIVSLAGQLHSTQYKQSPAKDTVQN